MSLGTGYLGDSVSLTGDSYSGEVTAKGPAAAFEIGIGGSIVPGFSLSGAFLLHSIGNTTLTGDTRTFVNPVSGTASPSRLTQDPQLSMLAVMADVYPSPRAGFHVGGALGFASMQARQDTEGSNGGFGIAPHAGYEWWVADYWGLGVQGRLLYARTRSPYGSARQTDRVVTFTLAFSATYN